MKKIIPIIVFLCGAYFGQAQTLYGTTFNGGNTGGGTINKYVISNNNLTVAKNFDHLYASPSSTLIQSDNGKFYGIAGRWPEVGSIFSFDPIQKVFSPITEFETINGSGVSGSLVKATDKKLYGMTHNGGAEGYGVIFNFDPETGVYKKIKDFDGINGSHPHDGSLLEGIDGKLYGMTSEGGSDGFGVIFSLDPVTGTYSKLKDFDGINGSFPNGSLIQTCDGMMYGMASSGGLNNFGVIFSFDPAVAVYRKLLDFNNLNGYNPVGDLVEAKDGKLYGLTLWGGISGQGVMFSFTPSSSFYTKLVDFQETSGTVPRGSLKQADNGLLYGMTYSGGTSGNGVVFSFNPFASVYKKIIDFDGINGSHPLSNNFMQAADGQLYGMTTSGGTGNCGVIFSINPLADTYTKLMDFGNNQNGSQVAASLIQTSNGEVYGMTNKGGSYGAGVIFTFNPTNLTFAKLKDFDGINGGNPIGCLTPDFDGKILYGLAYGGKNGMGVIFSFNPLTSIYTKLMDFDSSHRGTSVGSLIQAKNGKLYGLVHGKFIPGNPQLGSIFSFDPLTSSYTKELDFDDIVGAFPDGSLLEASNGKLYGMTALGGSRGQGNIFSFDPATLTGKNLFSFSGSNGAIPQGISLTQANDGLLYGLTHQGGSYGSGVIFSIDPETASFVKLFDFDGVNGATPLGKLIQASDGKLYGTTYQGGGYGYGVIYSFDPITKTFKKLADFDGKNGANPYYTGFIELNACNEDSVYFRDADGDGYGNNGDSVKACVQPAGYVKNKTDCNDNNAAIHVQVTFFRDADCDGFGDAGYSISVCESKPPAGYVSNNYDCDDNIKPGRCRNEVLMCHHGKEQCISIKEIQKKLRQGWTLGPCTGLPCDPGKTLMCYKGKTECIKTDEVQKKLHEKGRHWKLGSCISVAHRSGNEPEGIEKTFEPLQYRLSNYPNPFTGHTIIQYGLPYDSKVSIKVYDVLGRVVNELVNKNQKAGSYNLQFDAGKINKGLLFIRMIATSKENQFEQTNKMILQ